MSKKLMKIPSLLHPWQCNQPTTHSFRADDHIFKTLNSIFFDTSDNITTPDSWFTTSSECTCSNNSCEMNDDLEAVIHGVRSSGRLFFEPECTKSILQVTHTTTTKCFMPFKETVALAVESDDPYSDFKKSMQEVVESNALTDWEGLEELLGWYLKMNTKMNHGIIVGAFMDLLVGQVDDIDNRHSDATSYSSADSCFSSPPPGGISSL